MNAAELLADLTRRGIRLKADGDRLWYAPRSAGTPELVALLKAYKPELLAALPTEAEAHGIAQQDAADASHAAPDGLEGDPRLGPAGAPPDATEAGRAASVPLPNDEPARKPAGDSEPEAPHVEPRDLADVWRAVLDRLEADPEFLPPDAPPDAIEALRSARVEWADDEPADDPEAEALGSDGWPAGSIELDDLPRCPTCGTLERWQSGAGRWRCLECDPPTTADRLAERAATLRANRNDHTRQVG